VLEGAYTAIYQGLLRIY